MKSSKVLSYTLYIHSEKLIEIIKVFWLKFLWITRTSKEYFDNDFLQRELGLNWAVGHYSFYNRTARTTQIVRSITVFTKLAVKVIQRVESESLFHWNLKILVTTSKCLKNSEPYFFVTVQCNIVVKINRYLHKLN